MKTFEEIQREKILKSYWNSTDILKSDDIRESDTFKKVIEEFRAGNLRAPNGDKVVDRSQAIAIAYSEAEKLEKARPAKPIGTITNGYKKVATNKWVKVSSGGLDKKQLKDVYSRTRMAADIEPHYTDAAKNLDREAEVLKKELESLDDKEYSDEEVEKSVELGGELVKSNDPDSKNSKQNTENFTDSGELKDQKKENPDVEKSELFSILEQPFGDLAKSFRDDLEKARYVDNAENRKKMRVGQEYGNNSKKTGDSNKNKNSKTNSTKDIDHTSESIVMNNLDWGQTTDERNKNLDKYNSMKSESDREKFKRELKEKNDIGKDGVVGKTSSGKLVPEKRDPNHHKGFEDWSSEDHAEAAKHHSDKAAQLDKHATKLYKEGKSEESAQVASAADHHKGLARSHTVRMNEKKERGK